MLLSTDIVWDIISHMISALSVLLPLVGTGFLPVCWVLSGRGYLRSGRPRRWAPRRRRSSWCPQCRWQWPPRPAQTPADTHNESLSNRLWLFSPQGRVYGFIKVMRWFGHACCVTFLHMIPQLLSSFFPHTTSCWLRALLSHTHTLTHTQGIAA